MGKINKGLIKTVFFVAGGAFAGFLYYRFAGCASGSCPITSNPVRTMAYMGVMGWLMSMMFKEENGKCNM